MHEVGPVPVVAVLVILQSPGRPWLGQAALPVSSLLCPTASPSFFSKLMKRKKLREADLEPVWLHLSPVTCELGFFSPLFLSPSLKAPVTPVLPTDWLPPCACACSGQSLVMRGLELS